MGYENLYPTQSARGRSSKEPGVVYCKKCGFPCRSKNLSPKGGRGNARAADKTMPLHSHAGKGTEANLTTITLDAGVGGGTVQKYVPSVSGGCPNCGTYMWDQQTTMKEGGKDPSTQENVQTV